MKNRTRERLLSHTRYSDDFFSKPKLKFSGSSRRSYPRENDTSGPEKSGDEEGSVMTRSPLSSGDKAENEEENAGENEATEGTPKENMNLHDGGIFSASTGSNNNQSTDGNNISSVKQESPLNKKRKREVSLEEAANEFRLICDKLKMDKRIKKCEADIDFVQAVIQKNPVYNDLPFTFLKQLLTVRLRHDEVIQNYLHSIQRKISDEFGIAES
jgi:hypothetical protein